VSYDALRVAAFFDDYGEREWTRSEDGRTPSTSLATHVHFANSIYRMEAVVHGGNAMSERVLERAGFTREGVRRRLLLHAGCRVDATLFSRLADE
jgi:RimJ/RimL family protein N-acetyltransferase